MESLLAGLDPADRDNPALRALAARLAESRLSGRAQSTIAQHGRHWAKFADWLHRHTNGRLQPIGVAPTYVVLYLQELLDASERDGIGPSRVLSASSAIACLHWLHGIESPTQHPLCDTVREASRRLLTGRRLERDAVTAADIRRLVDRYGKRGALLRDLMHVTAFSLMYAAFLRFDDLCQITVHEDALVFRDDHLAIFVPKSKTDQQGEGRWVVVAKGQGEYCPVGLLDRLLRKGEYITRPRSPDEDVGPLVRAVDKSGMKLRQVTAVGALVPPSVLHHAPGALQDHVQGGGYHHSHHAALLPDWRRYGGCGGGGGAPGHQRARPVALGLLQRSLRSG